jgi:hypothetical protein
MTEYLLDHQWISLDTSLCLTLRAAYAVQIGFPANLSMQYRYNLALPHCSQVSIFIPKTRLSLCAQVIDWCFCALVFSCLVGKAFFALFRKAGVIVTRCRLFGGGPPRGVAPHKYAMKPSEVYAGCGYQCR